MSSKFEEWLDNVPPNHALIYRRVGILYLLDAWKAGAAAMVECLFNFSGLDEETKKKLIEAGVDMLTEDKE